MMQLHAVLVPPADVVQDALEAARALVPSTSAAGEAGGGFLGRLLGRRSASAPATPALTWATAAPEEVFVRLAKFGNVAAGDATHLAKAIGAKSGKWPVPGLHVSTLSVAGAHPYDVVAQLDGDLDALRDIFLNVNEVARLERFFLDRRSFRCELLLGPIEATTDEPAPDIAGKELAHEGPRWAPSHIILLRATYAAAGVTYSEFARVPLADAADDTRASTGA